MTQQEKHLWYDFCKMYPIKIVRQRTIFSYIVDFYCSSAKLAIEIDGGQHYEDDNIRKDAERTEKLNTLGVMVIRFSNRDIDTNFEGVCKTIHDVIQKRIKETK
jgi:very-short-patch-repair endonuclease